MPAWNRRSSSPPIKYSRACFVWVERAGCNFPCRFLCHLGLESDQRGVCDLNYIGRLIDSCRQRDDIRMAEKFGENDECLFVGIRARWFECSEKLLSVARMRAESDGGFDRIRKRPAGASLITSNSSTVLAVAMATSAGRLPQGSRSAT